MWWSWTWTAGVGFSVRCTATDWGKVLSVVQEQYARVPAKKCLIWLIQDLQFALLVVDPASRTFQLWDPIGDAYENETFVELSPMYTLVPIHRSQQGVCGIKTADIS